MARQAGVPAARHYSPAIWYECGAVSGGAADYVKGQNAGGWIQIVINSEP